LKTPEFSSVSSALVDGAFDADRPISAHLMREWVRSSNRAASRSACVFRWTGLGHDDLYTYAPAQWRPATPLGTVTVRKCGGVRKLRVGATLTVENGKRVGLSLWTDAQESLDPDMRAGVWVTGTGSSQLVTWEVPCPEDSEIQITPTMRAVVDPTSDTLVTSANWSGLSATTFGDATWGTPTVGPGGFGGSREWEPRCLSDQYVQAQYNAYPTTSVAAGWIVDPTSGYAIQRNGFYVWVWDSGTSGGGAVAEVGVCEGAVNGDASPLVSPEIWLVDSLPRLVGRVYTMRQLPTVALNSIAVYEG